VKYDSESKDSFSLHLLIHHPHLNWIAESFSSDRSVLDYGWGVNENWKGIGREQPEWIEEMRIFGESVD
jgi:hypothetical protein